MLARYWADRGDMEKGRELLLRARDLQHTEKGGKVKPGGIWLVDTSINALTNESKLIQLQVKSLGNEHFLFAITP